MKDKNFFEIAEWSHACFYSEFLFQAIWVLPKLKKIVIYEQKRFYSSTFRTGSYEDKRKIEKERRRRKKWIWKLIQSQNLASKSVGA